ncbi:hypothetical protein TBLA_0A07010 [Henningerozyma blattae CBS 6284]|uniref:Zn(2)-C6 fungal-type domain-containing protein n=1 Tax=Henningerozyma blattae (strain ATCC 34711 / CBS 6284 / DSM 70876 / NBRC 10599 / NRRL Y-10934 / UCD 77-7) TaxID=1071380 RepID=I2GWJ0_HENB6|nr:hypothetical protein TBLA_0A07010 [Tetrapisispora blattae CBS 6284]CCH58492.1 hypothetical protein TBLA_0A07010 [Tetrapisispora blattae CBS 6284]
MKSTGSYSKHGCLECKKAHIKCDERKPKCGRCCKLLIECRYEGSIILNSFGDKIVPVANENCNKITKERSTNNNNQYGANEDKNSNKEVNKRMKFNFVADRKKKSPNKPKKNSILVNPSLKFQRKFTLGPYKVPQTSQLKANMTPDVLKKERLIPIEIKENTATYLSSNHNEECKICVRNSAKKKKKDATLQPNDSSDSLNDNDIISYITDHNKPIFDKTDKVNEESWQNERSRKNIRITSEEYDGSGPSHLGCKKFSIKSCIPKTDMSLLTMLSFDPLIPEIPKLASISKFLPPRRLSKILMHDPLSKISSEVIDIFAPEIMNVCYSVLVTFLYQYASLISLEYRLIFLEETIISQPYCTIVYFASSIVKMTYNFENNQLGNIWNIHIRLPSLKCALQNMEVSEISSKSEKCIIDFFGLSYLCGYVSNSSLYSLIELTRNSGLMSGWYSILFSLYGVRSMFLNNELSFLENYEEIRPIIQSFYGKTKNMENKSNTLTKYGIHGFVLCVFEILEEAHLLSKESILALGDDLMIYKLSNISIKLEKSLKRSGENLIKKVEAIKETIFDVNNTSKIINNNNSEKNIFEQETMLCYLSLKSYISYFYLNCNKEEIMKYLREMLALCDNFSDVTLPMGVIFFWCVYMGAQICKTSDELDMYRSFLKLLQIHEIAKPSTTVHKAINQLTSFDTAMYKDLQVHNKEEDIKRVS